MNKFTQDDYCDIYQNKICDNCGKCLENDGVDIKAINIEDIAKTVEENKYLEEELNKALEDLKLEKDTFTIEEDIPMEEDVDILEEESDYIDAFDNIVYLDEIGVDEGANIDELTEEIYPGIRKLKQ